VARVLMNPPFNDPARQRVSPDARRRLAHVGPGGTLPRRIKSAARLPRPPGTPTLIWPGVSPAPRFAGAGSPLPPATARSAAVSVLRVHRGEEQAAVRILVRATKASRAPLVLLPGLVLNDRSGRSTAQAESVLRAGAALPLSEV